MSKDPRIAPKEMIVTRLKSAQQKRRLREPAQSPPRRKRAARRKRETAAARPDNEEPKDYYPDKQKRVFGEKKVFLKPKHKLKMVARTNKRKFNTPRKGIKSPAVTVTTPTDWLRSTLTMEDAVRLVEDTESLDEEDLMEILTCPSPVWWETPPDQDYCEEPIYTRRRDESPSETPAENCFQTQKVTRNDSKASTDSGIHADIEDKDSESFTSKNIITQKKDDRFNKKRKKLENVLGNIKNKALACKDDGKTEVKNDTVKKDSVDEVIEKLNDSKVDDTTNNFEDTIMKVDEEIKQTKVKKLSESTEGDLAELSFRDDDMLHDLENMDIPIESDAKSPSAESVIFINDDDCNKIIEIDDNTTNSDETNNTETTNVEVIEDSTDIKAEHINDSTNISNKDNSLTQLNIPEANIENAECTVTEKSPLDNEKLDPKLIEVPKNLPPLKKRPKFETPALPSPISFKSVTDTTETSSISSHDISDTISDTNIKFMTEDEIDSISDVEMKTDIKTEDITDEHNNFNNATNPKIDDELKSIKDTYITVYKIMPNENEENVGKFKNITEYSNDVETIKQVKVKSEIEENCKGQINSFYKKCKNVYRKRCKKDNEDFKADKTEVKTICDSCEPKKSITVAQDENVKYCLKCSSIFDTNECSYCLKSAITTKTCMTELIEDVGSVKTQLQ